MKGFSSKTQLNNEFKLADLAKSLAMEKAEKEEFKKIESITLTHAFNADTTGLKATDSVEIIYIYNIKLHNNQMPLNFIKTLDKKTKAHTVFEVMTRDSECLTAEEAKTPHSHKDKLWNCKTCLENCGATYTYIMGNKRFTDTVVIGEYIQREQDTEYALLPAHDAKTLEDLYCIMLAFVLDLNRRPNESADNLTQRRKRITELDREITKLERKKNSETQFNKKMAINEKIRALHGQIEGEK